MAQIIDTPGWFKSMYGKPVDSVQVDATQVRKREQQTNTKVGAAIWRKSENAAVDTYWEFMPVKIGDVQLWNPIIRLVARKNVVETPLVERDGSVKEIISMDDYVINIKGLIKTTNGQWPDDEVAQLTALWQKKEVLPISSALTAHFLNGNEYVLITNLTIPENQGHMESVLYEMEMTSDIPFELELKDSETGSTATGTVTVTSE